MAVSFLSSLNFELIKLIYDLCFLDVSDIRKMSWKVHLYFLFTWSLLISVTMSLHCFGTLKDDYQHKLSHVLSIIPGKRTISLYLLFLCWGKSLPKADIILLELKNLSKYQCLISNDFFFLCFFLFVYIYIYI